jgi:hypothetical protein
MKKIIFHLSLLSVLFAICITGCVSTQNVNIGKLSFGMSKSQVRSLIGPPERILSTRQLSGGYQEILQYRTPLDEVYALEFINNYLVGYEFLYDDIIYIPPPPSIRPPFGQPIFPHYRPNRPIRPPTYYPPARPPETRPPTRPERPSTRPERPSPEVRPPTTPVEETRPETRPEPPGDRQTSPRQSR